MKYINCKHSQNMGETPLDGNLKNSNKECTENFDKVKGSENADSLESLVGSILKSGQIQQALETYIASYSSDFLDNTFLELFVNGLVQKARENLSQKGSIHFKFICGMCGGIMTDPVTLKCGHTFSKKCILSSMKADDCFDCQKCSKRHSRQYISQLKNNVLICALIEKLWNIKEVNQKNSSETDSCVRLSIGISKSLAEISSTSSSKILEETEDCPLVNIEALQLHLLRFIFNSKLLQAKENLIKPFQDFLLQYRANITSEGITIRTPQITEKRENQFQYATPNNSIKCTGKVSKIEEAVKLQEMLENIGDIIEDIQGEDVIPNKVDTAKLDKKDFECALCKWTLWEPVSTPCGHTFCRVCLNRCLDHRPTCPLCKTSLACYLAERIISPTELIELAIQVLLPDDFCERKAMFENEMKELSNSGKDTEHVIPIFVCTMAYPTIPCLLHVFEPRYRLMIRQCMESGSKQFGMCVSVDNNMAEYGTMLKIGDVQYFEDGRSVVYTVGTKRFRVLSKGERDGYNIGTVEFLKDEAVVGVNLEDVKEIHDQVHKISQSWFHSLPREIKHQILQHFGSMPETEVDYLSSQNGPSWFWWMLAILPIETRSQLMILSMTSLPHRLKTLYKVLRHLQSTLMA